MLTTYTQTRVCSFFCKVLKIVICAYKMPRRPRKKSYRVAKQGKGFNEQQQNTTECTEIERSDESELNISGVGSDLASENSDILMEKYYQVVKVEDVLESKQEKTQCGNSIQQHDDVYQHENKDIAEASHSVDVKTELKNDVAPILHGSDGCDDGESTSDGVFGNSTQEISMDGYHDYTNCYDENVKSLILEHEQEPYVFGIDLGTMNTKAVISHPSTECTFALLDETGDKIIPTVVGFTDDIDHDLVGHQAVTHMDKQGGTAVYDVKRIIGRERSDPLVESKKTMLPFTISGDDPSTAEVSFEHKHYGLWVTMLPEELIQKVIRKLLCLAKRIKHNNIPRCTVLTVPSFFNNRQRSTLIQAARDACFDNVHLINEMTAEAIHCYTTGVIRDGQAVIFFHFGAGSMDCCVVAVEKMHIIVKSCNSNMYCGGQDLTNDLIIHLEEFIRDEEFTRETRNKLKLVCEDLKKELSSSFERTVYYPILTYKIKVTREEFENLCIDKFESIEGLVENTLNTSGFSQADIQKVILTGGSCGIPFVRAMFSTMFPNSKIVKISDPHVAAKGAAKYASDLYSQKETIRVTDIYPYRIYTSHDTSSNEIFPFNSQIPSKHQSVIDMEHSERMVFEAREQYAAVGSEDYRIGFFNVNNVEGTDVEINYTLDKSGVFRVQQGLEVSNETDVYYFK